MTLRRFVAAVLLLSLAGAVAWVVLPRKTDVGLPPARPLDPALTAARANELSEANERFCGACHVTPDPACFPAEAWTAEVRRGFRFFHESLRRDLDPPALADLAAFYRSRAPRHLEFDPPPAFDARFRRGPDLKSGGDGPASIAHLLFDSAAQRAPVLLVADMGTGRVSQADVSGAGGSLVTLATLKNPAHVTPADLDGDGLTDLLVADLGTYQPADHDEGRVIWLRNSRAGYDPVVLAEKLGRVADVRAADFTGEGVPDLVVAEFGWNRTGRVLLLEGLRAEGEVPQFRIKTIDERHGAIHVPVADLNDDGRPDFVALLSQEHETIVAFLNAGDGAFHREVISPSQDPAHGSSGIELVDLDRDGDLDVLATNGDMFDSYYLKPYHGITWLENKGGYPFTPHRLASMPGVHRALAADLDADGDLDVAAASLHPENLRPQPGVPSLPSLLWLEQTAPARFEPHAIERDAHRHAALEIADFDADEDPDLAVGSFRASGTQDADVTLWWNSGQPR